MLSRLSAGGGCSQLLLRGAACGLQRLLHTTTVVRSLAAVEKLYKELEGKKALPWENPISAEEAANVLGTFWGVDNIKPGAVLDLDVDQMEGLLRATTLGGGNKVLDNALFAHAESVTDRFFGKNVFYRGIVEFSNVCENDCGYCGIRKHQRRARRYTMPKEEVLEMAEWAFRHQLGTLMLQSGELNTPQRNQYIVDVVRAVRKRTIEMDLLDQGLDPKAVPLDTNDLGLCVALSVGELPRERYVEFREAGAARYLLRIESSNPDLYASIHPQAQKWENRIRCLNDLKDLGYMVGTGVMVGLPGQTLRDLAGDIMFFRGIGADMIGMGPYITETGTPVADMWDQQFGHLDKKKHMQDMLTLTTRMNALARITLGNVNISATTALQAIDAIGREIALRRGCNILMPILTPTKYREHYTLYEGKPCISDTADECQKCLSARLSMVNKKLKPKVWGDPPSYRETINPIKVQPTLGAHGFHTATLAAQQPKLTCDNCGEKVGAGAQQQHTPGCGVSFKAAAKSNGPAATGPAKGSDVQRVNIGIFGVMNAGKSSLMNRLTRSETSIVDAHPGTTADTKTVLMELHEVGPAKLFDTAGIDETGLLGEKKRRKVLSVIKETDVAVVVVDVGRHWQAPPEQLAADLHWERLLVEKAEQAGSEPVLVYNTKPPAGASGNPGWAPDTVVQRLQGVLNPDGHLFWRHMELADLGASTPLAEFLQESVKQAHKHHAVKSLPEEFLSEEAMVFLNIPMDAETPTMRLLRPQALVQEEAIRHFATTLAYRMNLDAARSADPSVRDAERRRFQKALAPVLAHQGPKVIVTDSQAVDIVHPWTLDEATGDELVPFTTFSIAMIHRQSQGQLPLFVEGIERYKSLKEGDRVLIAEACNHNRITEMCNDIGMVQIPRKIEQQRGVGIQLEHAFGREFPELDDTESGGLRRFALAIHCGGCMVDHQKIRARISDLKEAGVPVTNYGLLLSYAHSPQALERALAPWGLHCL
ncbi:hypothetical protein N2152v2_010922 [Parachlorella kessleri]